MKIADLIITGNHIEAQNIECVPAGTVGATVSLQFDEAWNGLTKTAVFIADGLKRDVYLIENEAVVPADILREPAAEVFVGVYGKDGTGALRMPTNWVSLYRVLGGAVPGCVPDLPPYPGWTDQMETTIQQNRDNLAAHVADRSNPHGVTAEQAGAIPAPEGGDIGDVLTKTESGWEPQKPSGGGGGVSQAYVDQQDTATLKAAKAYSDGKLVTIEIEDRGGQNFWTRPVTTANQIIDMVNAGKEVRLSFYDAITGTGDQIYPYENTRQGVCYFRRNVITADAVSRISWGVQYNGSIVATEIPYTPPIQTAYAVCHDEAAPASTAGNTWYIPKTLPKPSGKVGMMLDVLWKNGQVNGLGYDVRLVWGEPGGADNEEVVGVASTTDSLTGSHSIPTEGTVRYQLEEVSGRKRWRYVSGPLIPTQFSTATAAATADKVVPGLALGYLPGMEIYVQLDAGNTAPVMQLVPDEGATLPVYGNGTGAKTGAIPAGTILHLANAGDHWQIINSTVTDATHLPATVPAGLPEETEKNTQAVMDALNHKFQLFEENKADRSTYLLDNSTVTQADARDILTYADQYTGLIEFVSTSESKVAAVGYILSNLDGTCLVTIAPDGTSTQWSKDGFAKYGIEARSLVNEPMVDTDNLTVDVAGNPPVMYFLRGAKNKPEASGDDGSMLVVPHSISKQLFIYTDMDTGKMWTKTVTGTADSHSFGVWKAMGGGTPELKLLKTIVTEEPLKAIYTGVDGRNLKKIYLLVISKGAPGTDASLITLDVVKRANSALASSLVPGQRRSFSMIAEKDGSCIKYIYGRGVALNQEAGVIPNEGPFLMGDGSYGVQLKGQFSDNIGISVFHAHTGLFETGTTVQVWGA